ncbi:hypothetical protein MSTO_38760 [Mycobacterium stomatepiae]|uniref:Uncharacterized protein n=1 Tax=Mycobacterium stomatepiae TaxID=470076 RepID=A0A7I7QBX9_9MYCO|nr:hypothetical protein MSTO_38760 [Mycobacterium stomatepiae]
MHDEAGRVTGAGIQDSGALRDEGGFQSSTYGKFCQDRADVVFHRPDAGEQCRGDLAVGLAARKEMQYVDLAIGKVSDFSHSRPIYWVVEVSRDDLRSDLL